MPTYEYDCASCGGFTAVRPMSEYRDPQPCPKCASTAPRVTLTVPAFKGMFSSMSERSSGAAMPSRSMQSCCQSGGCACR